MDHFFINAKYKRGRRLFASSENDDEAFKDDKNICDDNDGDGGEDEDKMKIMMMTAMVTVNCLKLEAKRDRLLKFHK